MRPESNRPELESELESPSRLFGEDTGFAQVRIAVFQYFAVAVFLFLVAGFWILQVRDHQANSEAAERNSIKAVPIPAPRGKILDRDGRVIVDNYAAYRVFLTQENLKLEHLEPIASGLHLDVEELRGRVQKYSMGPRYVPIPIKQDLSPADLAFVESHRDPETYPELELIEAHRRLYPKSGLAAHVLGYVGEVSEAELKTKDFSKYSQGDTVGKFGLERQYNDALTGIDRKLDVIEKGSVAEGEAQISGMNKRHS